jgi:hypothetical protein
MNRFFPYTYSVHALREMTYDPNWLNWFIDVIIMLSFSVGVSAITFYFWNKRKTIQENKTMKKVTKKKKTTLKKSTVLKKNNKVVKNV